MKWRPERSVIYQRFVFERARLERIAAVQLEKSDRLSGQEAIIQSAIAQKPGEQVLEEIECIRLMPNEPAREGSILL